MNDYFRVESAGEALLSRFRCWNLEFRAVIHEPVLDYEKAAEIRERFGLRGCETKSLFLKGKNGDFFVFFTLAERRVDFRALKGVLGIRLELGTFDELSRETGFTPGCVGPFGLKRHIILVVDMSLFESPLLIFSPGDSNMTIEMTGNSFLKALEGVENRVIQVRV